MKLVYFLCLVLSLQSCLIQGQDKDNYFILHLENNQRVQYPASFRIELGGFTKDDFRLAIFEKIKAEGRKCQYIIDLPLLKKGKHEFKGIAGANAVVMLYSDTHKIYNFLTSYVKGTVHIKKINSSKRLISGKIYFDIYGEDHLPKKTPDYRPIHIPIMSVEGHFKNVTYKLYKKSKKK